VFTVSAPIIVPSDSLADVLTVTHTEAFAEDAE